MQKIPPPGDYASAADSRDMSAVLRTGPCPNFEKLTAFEFLETHAQKFKTCASQEDIKAVNEEVASQKKLFSSLCGSCRVAVRELETAIAKRDKAEKEKQEKHKKAEEAA